MAPDTLRKDNPGLVVARVFPGFLNVGWSCPLVSCGNLPDGFVFT